MVLLKFRCTSTGLIFVVLLIWIKTSNLKYSEENIKCEKAISVLFQPVILWSCHPLILVSGGLLLESSLAATHMMQVCYYLVRMERWEWTFRYTTMALRWNWNLCRWRASNFDLCSALMAIEQWGFFSVPHLLWHGASVYNGHLRGPMILTPIAERLAVELSLPVFTT